jgi:glycosyltransferase involved in cell wall biosynthesis
MPPASRDGDDAGPIQLAVDASSLSDGSQYRGIGAYLRGSLEALAARDGVRITALSPSPAPRLPDGVQWVPVELSRWRRRAAVDAVPRSALDLRPDVFWSPAQSPPRDYPGARVQTLLDLTPLVFDAPELRRDAKRWLSHRDSMRAADAVLCPSQSSADQGLRFFDLDPARVHVVTIGIEPMFRPGPAPAVDEPYVLFVSSWGPHKGFTEAMAVAAAIAEAGYPHRLVMAGRNDEWMLQQVERARGASRRPDRVEVRGYVDDLPALYRGATALICTSRAEGFGLPAAEAMACGTPVVSFDNTSLPEVVGDGGLLVPDGDVAELVTALRSVIDDPAVASRLAAAGPRRATAFSWADAAEQMERIFRQVARASSS